jgi:amino acid adenylation domain-containing protein
MKAGAAYLPIDLAYPPERVTFMLNDANARLLVTTSDLRAKLPATGATVVCIDELLAQPAEDDEREPEAAVGADHLAYVIYTSGTTGKPKGSMVTHRNVVRLFSCTEHWYEFDERDVWTLFHSHAFDFSVWEIWGALLYGGRLVVVPYLTTRSPDAFRALLAQERVTVLNQTPSAFRQLIAADATADHSSLALRLVILGGEALELQSLRPWFERHGDQKPRLVNMYGITETTVHVTYRPITREDLSHGSVIGVPIPDLNVYILDSSGQPVPVGVPGEMYVGGAGLARGYLNRSDLTAQRFVPDHLSGRTEARLYRTGDLARFLPGRDIEYLGRVDQQVKIRGFRIELGEIEHVLCEHPQVREAVVLARDFGPGDTRLIAYLVACDGIEQSASALQAHLRAQLPEYMVPSVFVMLDALPLTNNGKLDRRALPEPAQERPELQRRYVAPRTPTERAVAEIWTEVLGLTEVGIHDNFFDLGGHSLLLLRVHEQLQRRFDANLPVTALFQYSTIVAIATHLGGDVEPSPSVNQARRRAEKQRQILARRHANTRK